MASSESAASLSAGILVVVLSIQERLLEFVAIHFVRRVGLGGGGGSNFMPWCFDNYYEKVGTVLAREGTVLAREFDKYVKHMMKLQKTESIFYIHIVP